MAPIFPIPTTRSSDLLVQTRLLAQLQTDQVELLRLQTQLSTGRRVLAPSEDAPAALRGISLQKLLEQKEQVQTNLVTSQSFVAASDSALSRVSGLIADLRGLAVSLSDSTTSQQQRDAGRQEILRGVQQLVDVGNQQFRGRYLFTGSQTTVQPFEFVDGAVRFNGNDLELNSYSDIDLLFPTNIPGNEVFGAVSPEVQGIADLNPILTADTRLTDLRGGNGVSQGSFIVSDGSDTVAIDISTAETLRDVVQLIESNPPAGRTVKVRIVADHLEVDIDDAGGGNLTIREVGGGTTAGELGILEKDGTFTSPIIGEDLDPQLRLTTQLRNILGVRASSVIELAGSNNDLLIEARQRGSASNGVAIQFVNDGLLRAAPTLSGGSETVLYSATAVAARAALTFSGPNNNLVITADTPGTAFNNVQVDVVDAGAIGNAATVAYDPVGKVLTLGVDNAGMTEVQTLINEIALNSPFTAAYDASLAADGGYVPTAAISVADAASNFGNTGNSGGEANTIFVNVNVAATTANDIVAALNADAAVSAAFDVRLDGKDSTTSFTEGQGLVDVAASATTSGGSGIEFDQSSGIQFVNGGETHTITFQDSVTVEDFLNTLNGSRANVVAEINEDRTGINIRSRLSGADFHIGENGGTTATELGVRSFTLDTQLSDLNHGRGVHSVDGVDFVIRRNDGVELEIDISTAETIGDVLNLINNHADNTGDRVTATLAPIGNGIQLVDDNPVGLGTLTVIKDVFSEAVWDLGLVPQGVTETTPSNGAGPTAATATLSLDPPNELNTGIVLTANQAGDGFNGVQVIIANTIPPAAPPVVSFDPNAKTLIIDVDPASTTASDVRSAINAEGTFSATAETAIDPTNDSSGLFAQAPGILTATSGGTPNPSALQATALAVFAAPNTALQFTAAQAGTAYNAVTIEFQNTLAGAGDVAVVSYSAATKRLIIEIDDTAGSGTTAATVMQEVNTHGVFSASLDISTDPTNDGSGVLAFTGAAALTDGGTPEILSGADSNRLEAKGVFSALLRLNDGLAEFDLREINRAVAMLDEAVIQLNFSRGELGARQQGLEVLAERLVDEEIILRSTLSTEIETDFAEAVSDLTARQATLQASLQLIGRTFQLSLLDFV